MKTLFILMSLSLSVSAFANTPYYVEPMNCTGTIFGNTSQVHPSYYRTGMKFTSFYSVRKADGSYADSLEVRIGYFKKSEPIVFDDQRLGSSIWYTGPLYKTNSNVYRSSLGGRNDHLTLKVTSSRRTKKGVIQTLSGTYSIPNSVAGSYGYRLTCSAVVVPAPSRVIDNTRPF
jgi:hypothetical protein